MYNTLNVKYGTWYLSPSEVTFGSMQSFGEMQKATGNYEITRYTLRGQDNVRFSYIIGCFGTYVSSKRSKCNL